MAHLPESLRVLAPTQRGHGDASAPDSSRVAGFAADLESFLNEMVLERFALTGHSMGVNRPSSAGC
jgi:pimeloyl-ACP methyl ester carboxylesterase